MGGCRGDYLVSWKAGWAGMSIGWEGVKYRGRVVIGAHQRAACPIYSVMSPVFFSTSTPDSVRVAVGMSSGLGKGS